MLYSARFGIKIGSDGVYLSSSNKSKKFLNFFNNKFKIIGSAHNQIEYFHKKQQGCSALMISPLFYNKKYSKNKILGPIKINLITKNDVMYANDYVKKSFYKETEKVLGYYSNFANALNRISKEKFYQNQGEYETIQEYLNTWNTVKEGMESMLNKIEI